MLASKVLDPQSGETHLKYGLLYFFSLDELRGRVVRILDDEIEGNHP